MIKTGRQVNVMLGHGDSERPNLLSGTFGDSGDVVLLSGGYMQRRSAISKKRNARAGGGYYARWNDPYWRPREYPRLRSRTLTPGD